MHSNLNNFASQPQATITLEYLVRTLDAKGIKLTREQFNALTNFNDKIPLSFLNDYEKIGALTRSIPELNQKQLANDAIHAKRSKIKKGTPQLPIQFGRMLRNHEIQQVFLPPNETLDEAIQNELAAKIVQKYDMYNHHPYYSRTQDHQITTGPTYTHIPESRFSVNTKSDFFKGIDQSFDVGVGKDLLKPQINFKPKVSSNIKDVAVDFSKGSDTQEMVISYRDGGKRVLEFKDPQLAKNLDNSSSIYAQTIPQYNPSLVNLTMPDLNSSKVLRTIFTNKNPNKITPQERSAIINSAIYGVSLKKPDVSKPVFLSKKDFPQPRYQLLQDSFALRRSFLENRWPTLHQTNNLKRMADLNNDHVTSSFLIKKLKDNLGVSRINLDSIREVGDDSVIESSISF
jgi:hypothetical protein